MTDPGTGIYASAAVALHQGQLLSGRQLGQVAAAVAGHLERDGQQQCGAGSSIALHMGSPFLLAAVLVALQSRRCHAVLLPHLRPGFVADIAGEVDHILADEQVAGGSCLPSLGSLLQESVALVPLRPQWTCPISLLTSGSSGRPTRVAKQPRQLLAEAQMLEVAFGSRIEPDRVFAGSTSHQHLFGFTFRLIWPLFTGRTFANRQAKYPNQITRGAGVGRRTVFITSPSFLQRAMDLVAPATLAEVEFFGFCSGGPLPADLASLVNRQPGCQLLEIYGSTETGALASRCTSSTAFDQPWNPLPGVAVEVQDNSLRVQAEHIAGSTWLQTSDRVQPGADGGFLLLGRTDAIVKIADKRVSLTNLEQLAGEHPSVSAAKAVLLADQRLAMAVVPSDRGWQQVQALGKDAALRDLRRHLANHVDAATVPKRWRLVKRLPRNDQGKIEQAALLALFASPVQMAWQELAADADHWLGDAVVDPALPELDGHFPGNPVVPGVAQVAWAARAAERFLSLPGCTGSLQAVKFSQVLRPGQRVQLDLRYNREAGWVQFRISAQDQLYSQGRLVVAHA